GGASARAQMPYLGSSRGHRLLLSSSGITAASCHRQRRLATSSRSSQHGSRSSAVFGCSLAGLPDTSQMNVAAAAFVDLEHVRDAYSKVGGGAHRRDASNRCACFRLRRSSEVEAT